MKIQLIAFGDKSPERAHANDAGPDVFSPAPNNSEKLFPVSSISCIEADKSVDSVFAF